MLIVELSWDNSTRLWPWLGLCNIAETERKTDKTDRQGLQWVGINARERHSHARHFCNLAFAGLKELFFQENARSRAGNTVLSMGTQILNELVSVNLVKIMA